MILIESGEEFLDRPRLAFWVRPVDLIWRLAVIATGVGFNHACVDRKSFTLNETRIHARSYYRLEELPEEVAVAETSMPIDRECRVVGHFVFEIEAAEMG